MFLDKYTYTDKIYEQHHGFMSKKPIATILCFSVILQINNKSQFSFPKKQ